MGERPRLTNQVLSQLYWSDYVNSIKLAELFKLQAVLSEKKMNIKARVARGAAVAAKTMGGGRSLQRSFATAGNSAPLKKYPRKPPTFHVDMDKTKSVTAGNAAKLDAGIMTKCSSAVFQMYDHEGNYLGTIMTHRGVGPVGEYAKALISELNNYPKGSVPKIRAIQTSSDTIIRADTRSQSTTPVGTHQCTHDDLLSHLTAIGIPEDEARAISETGPGVGPGQTTCTANVQKNGELKIPKRLGMFQYVKQLVFGAQEVASKEDEEDARSQEVSEQKEN